MNLNELINVIKGDKLFDNNIFIKEIKIDSRKINEGDLFIALKGVNYDGHDYVLEAIEKGAIACIVSNDINNPKCIKVNDTYESLFDIAHYIRNKYNIPLIGITGSNGKTTTKDLISHILSSNYKVLKNEGSKNNLIGISDTLFKLDDNYNIIVIEMGSNHNGEISYLSKMCNPNLSVITNIGTSHIEYFKTRKNIFREKISILDGMNQKKIIVNGDDKYLKKLNCYRCGINDYNDLIAYNIKENINKIKFNIYLDKEYTIKFNNPGRHFITDILLAIKCCLEYGINIKTILKRISTFKLTNKRMNIIKLKDKIVINDCYNASYESVMGGLNYLDLINEHKTIILGDILELGKHSKKIHKKINKRLKKVNNKTVITLGNYTRYINSIHFNNIEDLIEYLNNNYIKGYIYIKGSRRMNLDYIVDYFCRRG